jgi:sugar phosphate isomerase/epimerase
MNLSVTNIAWSRRDDDAVFGMLRDYDFTGVEIAPTMIVPEAPYTRINEALRYRNALWSLFGLEIPSMQSIWFGVKDRIFGSAEERTRLTAYSKQAIHYAEAIYCKNLVFGCPRNRSLPDGADPKIAVPFFRELGEYAKDHNTVLAMEANPPIYNTNYINTTKEAIGLIREVDSEGFLLNLDVGTMVENGENVSVLEGAEKLIHHVHISEPGLVPLQKRELHKELAAFLRSFSYEGWVSIEVRRQEDPGELERMLEYVAGLFA